MDGNQVLEALCNGTIRPASTYTVPDPFATMTMFIALYLSSKGEDLIHHILSLLRFKDVMPPIAMSDLTTCELDFTNAYEKLDATNFVGNVKLPMGPFSNFLNTLLDAPLPLWFDVSRLPSAHWVIHSEGSLLVPLMDPPIPAASLSTTELSATLLSSCGQAIEQSLPSVAQSIGDSIESIIQSEIEKTQESLKKTQVLSTAGLVVGSLATIGLGILGGYQLWSSLRPKRYRP
ncbi:MAG: hypothetical protein LBI20_00665 [Holosporales bacterium]|nr:hypothetical protein [Holosporales bacterium]